MSVVHRAGPVRDGLQRCERCGADLHAAPDGTGWEQGSEVYDEHLAEGVHLSSVPVDGAVPCRPVDLP